MSGLLLCLLAVVADPPKQSAKAAEIYERVAGEMAAQQAALDQLQGQSQQ